MRVLAIYFAILSLLTALNGSQAFWFGGGNDNPKKRRVSSRRRLTEEGAAAPLDVDVDAATGTVKPTEEQRVAAEQAKSCDGQLAQALVAANDAELKAQQERDEARAATNDVMKQLGELQVQIQSLEAKLAVASKDGELAVQKVTQDKDAELEALTTQLAQAVADKETAVAAAEQAKDKTIASLKQKLEASKGDVQQKMELQLDEANAKADAIQAEMNAKLEQQQKEAEELLAATKEESKRMLVDQVGTLKDQMKDMESQAKSALAKKDNTIQEIKTQNERLSKYQEEMLAKNREYEKELEHWRSTFANRGYCNMTHITTDIYQTTMHVYSNAAQAASVAASKTAEAATVAATELNVHGRRLAKELLVHAEYGYNKAIETYHAQYKKQWPKIKPHYDKHLSPVVDKFLQWKAKEVDPKLAAVGEQYRKIKTEEIDPRLQYLNSERKKLFSRMVAAYEVHCRDAYKLSRQLAREHGYMEKFQQVGPHIKDSCDNAEHSMTIAVRVVAILLLLPFTGRIFGLAWWLVRMVVHIFLTITLLRFILPRGGPKTTKKKTKVKKEQPVPNKVPSNSGAAATKKRGHRNPVQ